MTVIVKIPVEIPEDTIAELAKRAAEAMVKTDPDIVSIVRCKDCIYWGKCLACKFFGDRVFEDDFCSRGVRREKQ